MEQWEREWGAAINLGLEKSDQRHWMHLQLPLKIVVKHGKNGLFVDTNLLVLVHN